MESQQRFQLRRNDHSVNLGHDFEDLRQQGEFVDVTLACEGQTLKGHKVVLSSCSSYLRRVLRDNPCQHPVVILKDVKFADMEVLVNFMYKGEVDVTRTELTTILDLADTLEVKGLAEIVKEHERMQYTLGVEGGCLPLADLSHCPGNLWPEIQDTTATSDSSPKRHKVTHIRSIQEQPEGVWGIGEQPATFTGNHGTSQTAACVSQEHQGGSENDASSLSERFSVKIERLSPCELLENDQPTSSEMPFPPQSSSREEFGWGSFDEDVAGSSDVNPALSMPAEESKAMKKGKRLTIAQQYEIISRIENGERSRKLAKEYQVVPSTISRVKRRKTRVQAFQSNKFLRKRIIDSSVTRVEKALYSWILEQKALNNPISGSILKAKALELNEQLNECSKFKASDSWLYKFKRRYEVEWS